MQIDFYFDFLSPYAYLARHKLIELAAAYEASIVYRPIDLAHAKLAIGNNGPANRQLPVKLAYLTVDLKRWADLYGIPFGGIKNHNSERLNIGTFFARSEQEVAAYVRETYHVLWGIGEAPDDEATIRRIARSLGWSETDFLDFTTSESGQAAYRRSTDEAISKRVFGVPMVMLGEQQWWGNDRLFMLEAALKARAHEHRVAPG